MASYLAHPVVAREGLLKAALHAVAEGSHPRQGVAVGQYGEGGEGGRARQGVAPEGRAVGPRAQHLMSGAAGEGRADGEAIGDTLRRGQHVRQDPGVLVGEEAARAPGAALHFIEHKQPALGIAQRPEPREVIRRRHDDAAFPLNGFDEYGHHVALMLRNAFHRGQIAEGGPHEARDQGLEAGLHLAVARGREGRHGAAVEGPFHHDDRWVGNALAVAVEPGQLDGGFVGLGAGIAEEGLLHAREGAKALGQLFLQGDAIEIGGVDQRAGLLRDGLGDDGMGVAQAADGDAREGVEVALAVLVGQPCAGAADEGHGKARIGIHHGGGSHEPLLKKQNGDPNVAKRVCYGAPTLEAIYLGPFFKLSAALAVI